MRDSFVRWTWSSDAPAAAGWRALLTPLSWAFGAGVAARNRAYDAGMFASTPLALPAISVGNLTVGGTGKTPVAAWLASRLAAGGARPAVVLRGYGDDEPEVHRRLNPGVTVVVDADRARGTSAARDAGATVVVLDDAFQHRRARRDADLVLVSADAAGARRLLPAGPWREPLSSLSRATHVLVTRKRASAEAARSLLADVRRAAPGAGAAVVHLAPGNVVEWGSGTVEAVSSLEGRRVLAVSGIGDPAAFRAQLEDAGARADALSYGDHHRFTAVDAAEIVRRGAGFDRVVCTLKDAVKLGAHWPREAPPMWYLSLRVTLEGAADDFERLIARFARPPLT